MNEIYLKVYSNRSELVHSNGYIEIFLEGVKSDAAKARYEIIRNEFKNNYLQKQIELCQNREAVDLGFHKLDNECIELIEQMVNSVTSQVGRALIGITIMQLCIKSIAPNQSIRLHKGGHNRNKFSWVEGISMRSLDKSFITPVLREYGLLSLNADGFMMTRSLAENYPYSIVYKADILGSKYQWIKIVEKIEIGTMHPDIALRFLLSQLLNRAKEFSVLSESMLESLRMFLSNSSEKLIYQVIITHIDTSDYAARLMEIAMHSFIQAMSLNEVFADVELAPLSQMRSANKKHGNIGDIEILQDHQIVESWDSKYGKSYLRDEVEEINEKLFKHSEVQVAGFVTSTPPDRSEELRSRIEDIKIFHGVDIYILSFDEWIKRQLLLVEASRAATRQAICREWLLAYGESLAQKRRSIAPIDEPCNKWVASLKDILESTQVV